MSAIWVFDYTESKHTLYRGKDCMKKFCEALREHTKIYIFFFSKKQKNVIVNKRRIKTTSKCKKFLHLWKKNLKKKLSESIDY